MKKLLQATVTVSFLLTPFVWANSEASTSVRQQDSQSQTERKSAQESLQRSETETDTRNIGQEKSDSQTITKTLSETRTATQSVTRTQSGTWKVDINPVVYFLKQLRTMGWDREAFYLSPDDVGTSAFVGGNSRIINLNQKQAIDNSASMHGQLSSAQAEKVKRAVQILYVTSVLIEDAILILNSSREEITLLNVEQKAKEALEVAYVGLKSKNLRLDIYECRYGGNKDTFTCNQGEWMLQINPSIPQLLQFGTARYSANRIGHATPTLSLSIANSDSDAMQIALADSESRAVATMVRDFTSQLRSKGQSKVANEIETKMLEKAMTSNLSREASNVVHAISTGNPLAVLKIFG